MQDYERFVSVDVETSGLIAGEHSILSIGACSVFGPPKEFYIELKPINSNVTAKAMEINKLDFMALTVSGIDPVIALNSLLVWTVTGFYSRPIFVGQNASFDWGFLEYYFNRFNLDNPFGYAPLDMKSYFYGKFNVEWRDTRSKDIQKFFKSTIKSNHNALTDAQAQAEAFAAMYLFQPKERTIEETPSQPPTPRTPHFE